MADCREGGAFIDHVTSVSRGDLIDTSGIGVGCVDNHHLQLSGLTTEFQKPIIHADNSPGIIGDYTVLGPGDGVIEHFCSAGDFVPLPH